MKLATLPDDSRDGRLVVVSRDLTVMADASAIAPSLRQALENWSSARPALAELAERVEAGTASVRPFAQEETLAPLPRTWQWFDASAFASHGALVSKALGVEPIPMESPLMYQGVPQFLPPYADVPMIGEEHGIDFEGELGVVLSDVPYGVAAEDAGDYIVGFVLINDWSLRRILPVEMGLKFGYIHSKPACSLGPVFVTPDELGDDWHDSQLALTLEVDFRGERFGAPRGDAMTWGFDELITHAARTRTLDAGTVIGSGTVSNDRYREVGSTCISERRGIETIDHGSAVTEFMSFGESVRMRAVDSAGRDVFGVIEQRVVPVGQR